MHKFFKFFAQIIEETDVSNIPDKDMHGKTLTVTTAQEKEIAHIAKLAASELENKEFWNQGGLAKYQSLWEKNSDIFTIFCIDGKLVAYICLFPLIAHSHLNRRISKYNIGPEHISPDYHDSKYIFIDAVLVHNAYQRDPQLKKRIYIELLRKIKLFSAKDEIVAIYTEAVFDSLNNFLGELGFSKPKKALGGSNIRYTLHENFAAPKLSNDAVQTQMSNADILIHKFEKVLEDLGKVSLTPVHVSSKVEDRFFDGKNVGTFEERNACKLSADSVLIKQLVGKTLPFYTHSIYRNKIDGVAVKEHWLSRSFLVFGSKVMGKHIPVNFFTASLQGKVTKQFMYAGIATFSLDQKDIFITVFPELMRVRSEMKNEDGNWQAYHEPGERSPIKISGRILMDQHKSLELIENEGMLALHITTFSYHIKNTVSKIGLLEITNRKVKIDPGFIGTEVNSDGPVLKAVKLYLMRAHKVTINSMKNTIINNYRHIEAWMEEQFEVLKGRTNTYYELFYCKHDSDEERATRFAKVWFFPNGVVCIERRYTQNKGNKVEMIEEKYYGEINVRHNKAGNKFLYIQAIAMQSGKQGQLTGALNQNYRELFMIIFWPKDSKFEFDYTRGILLGDSDVNHLETAVDPIIEANVCALCKANSHWKGKFPLKRRQSIFDPARIKNIDDVFLKDVLKPKGLTLDPAKLKEIIESGDPFKDLPACLQIKFDREHCRYPWVAENQ